MNDFVRKEMQERTLEALASLKKGFEFTNTFKMYTSFQIGPYFVQSAEVLDNPQLYEQTIKDTANLAMHLLRHAPIDYVAGGESRDWIFSFPVIRTLQKPGLMIYKDGKIYPERDLNQKTIAVVSDLNNEGSSYKRQWVPAMQKRGARISHAIFLVDRLEDGVDVLSKLGIENDAVAKLNHHAWDYLRKIGKVDEEIYRNLRKRGNTKEERHAWALDMLRSQQGIEQLAAYLQDPKTRERAQGVVNIGYPEIKEELAERLRQFEGLKFFGFPSEDTK